MGRSTTDQSTFDKLSLAGKVAIVTGSTQGLGERIAHLFAARGIAGLTICGRNAANGARVKAELEATGVEVVFVEADLAEVDDVRRVTAAADEAFGRVDILVNAAAITDRGTIWDTKPELFDRMFAVNVRAPFFLMQDAATIMRRNESPGSIVNIISMSGHGGQSFITLTKNVAFSVMRNGIRVNGLTIGWMDTPGEDRIMKTYHAADANWREKAYASLPTGRMLQPEEVARAVAYLASDESGMMTGSIIDFDQSVLGCYESAPQPAPIAAE
jgi:NAD(P)-dependent dehydrogenase (short-subunit alcohol dehydrogenase family)